MNLKSSNRLRGSRTFKVFEDTYWGRGKYDQQDGYSSKEIYDAREKLFKTYKLRKRSGRLPNYVKNIGNEHNKIVDHTESYLASYNDKEGWLLVMSPYNCESVPEHWQKFDNVYGPNATTFIRFVERNKNSREHLKFYTRMRF